NQLKTRLAESTILFGLCLSSFCCPRSLRVQLRLQSLLSGAGPQEGTMAKAAATGRNLSLVLCLFVLLSCLGFSLQPHTHSFTCDVIVKAGTTPGQSWCEGQCSVDGEPLLQYNDSKFIPLGDLGNATNGAQVWTDMIQRLDYLRQEFRKMLANTKQEMTEISGKCGIEYRGRD
ncbi:hypothetical protein U0070_002946, partial [Myodes glareolus]